jgi:maleylpyruvate isomerase
MDKTLLHGYFRSSAAFRVRIALNYKKIPYDQATRHLRKGEQRAPEFLKLNAQGLVPALEIDGHTLTQSLAIIEYLEETRPEPALLPKDVYGRARARSIAYAHAMEIHPINNLRILQDIEKRFGADPAAVAEWFRHWVAETFAPIEKRLSSETETGEFSHGDTPTLADVCLVPQVFNNLRFDVDMTPYPTINRIHKACMALPAFADAAPAKQPDAE